MRDNPFAAYNISGLGQRQFGRAWPAVKSLYEHLTQIDHIYNNMQAVREAANNLSRGIISIEKMALAPGNTTFVEWPTGLNIEDLLYYTVLVVDRNGAIYSEASGYFDTVIKNGALEVMIDAGAPETIDGGIIRWTIDYKN